MFRDIVKKFRSCKERRYANPNKVLKEAKKILRQKSMIADNIKDGYVECILKRRLTGDDYWKLVVSCHNSGIKLESKWKGPGLESYSFLMKA